MVFRPVQEVERAARVQGAMDRVFREHSGLLSRLAGGMGNASAGKPRKARAKKKTR